MSRRGVTLGAIAAPIAAAALAQSVTLPPGLKDAAATEVAASAPDRQASAHRLLLASRFRERQAVLSGDSLQAARADLLADCVNRAAEGRDVSFCNATATPGPRVANALAASKPHMLDDVMAASETIYASHFTAAEMDEITRFFRSPIGQKYGQEYPRILEEVQTRKHAIAKRYLVAAYAAPAVRNTKP